MRILVLSFYYHPDLCAGSFRAKSFVDTLSQLGGEDLQIDVLTTVPNRYNSFNVAYADEEQVGNVRIKRFSIPRHKSGLYTQSISYTNYVSKVLWHIRKRRYDLVFATSSRLFTAFLGALAARINGAKLYLDIRDIFVETMEEVLAGKPLRFLLPVLGMVERWTITRAHRVNLVSQGFHSYFAGGIRTSSIPIIRME
jgi:hypothetical protein